MKSRTASYLRTSRSDMQCALNLVVGKGATDTKDFPYNLHTRKGKKNPLPRPGRTQKDRRGTIHAPVGKESFKSYKVPLEKERVDKGSRRGKSKKEAEGLE